jgi:2,4-dienoyl-CoA reductase-like NADH-dependent reductase (Old Yellow Enzyme family)
LTLPNRIVMPPMTRSRAADGNVATAEMAAYYAQRASAGLIVSEGTQISPQGQGYAWTPGIHSPEQVQGWRQVTDAVHAAGGRIYAQLWHVGRFRTWRCSRVVRTGVVVGAAGRRREGVRRSALAQARKRAWAR